MSDSSTVERDGKDSSERLAAVSYLGCYPIMSPLVFKALPEHGSPPLSARQICERVRYGSRTTVRMLLCIMARAGIVEVDKAPGPRGCDMNVYVRAPGLGDDDFEDATLVYGDGEP